MIKDLHGFKPCPEKENIKFNATRYTEHEGMFIKGAGESEDNTERFLLYKKLPYVNVYERNYIKTWMGLDYRCDYIFLGSKDLWVFFAVDGTLVALDFNPFDDTKQHLQALSIDKVKGLDDATKNPLETLRGDIYHTTPDEFEKIISHPLVVDRYEERKLGLEVVGEPPDSFMIDKVSSGELDEYHIHFNGIHFIIKKGGVMNNFELHEKATQLADTTTPYALAKDYLLVLEELEIAINIIEESGVDFSEAMEAFKDKL